MKEPVMKRGEIKMEWNYYDTFITVSADCPAEYGKEPPDKKDGKTKPGIEFELIANDPYVYTQEELLYQVHIRHKHISEEVLAAQGNQLREDFFRNPMPCMRASMLPKKYGWGVHFNSEGKAALVPVESEDYQHFLEGEKGDVKIIAAMRNSKKSAEK